MKYVISWRERPAASARDYEAAHERVLQIFKDWKMPASFSMLQFVVRIGDYGGYMIVETDKPTDIHYVTSFFAVFEFKVEPVVDVMDAVAVEVKAIEYRKKNFSKQRGSNGSEITGMRPGTSQNPVTDNVFIRR